MKTSDLCGPSDYDVKGNKGHERMSIVKGCSIAAVFFAMVVAPAVAGPIGANKYYIKTISISRVTTSHLSAEALYNYGGTPGAQFPPMSVDPNYTGGQAGTLDLTGLATSSFDQTTGLAHANPLYGPGPDQSAASYAAADLATGSLHASGQGVGVATGIGEAIMSDTLHFTIAGATASTVTPITVHWTLDGSWSYNPNAWYGNVYGDLVLNGWGGANVVANMGGNGVVNVPLDFWGTLNGQAGWASYHYDSHTTTDIDFTGVYNLVGASVDLPIYSNLTVEAGGGLIDGGYTATPTTIDFSNTGKVDLILPSNVSFTSDSGVFLTPEPTALLLLGTGLGGLTCAGRRKKRA